MDIHLKFNTVNNNDGLGETKEIHFNGRVVSVINPKHMGMSVICSSFVGFVNLLVVLIC